MVPRSPLQCSTMDSATKVGCRGGRSSSSLERKGSYSRLSSTYFKCRAIKSHVNEHLRIRPEISASTAVYRQISELKRRKLQQPQFWMQSGESLTCLSDLGNKMRRRLDDSACRILNPSV